MNLVVPVERDDGVVVFAHSAPISSQAFATYYRPLSLTYARLVEDNLIRAGGARVADFTLEEVSRATNSWDDDKGRVGVKRGLVDEVGRMTNVFAPNAGGGWEMLPLHEAAAAGNLSADEAREVRAAAIFFTCVSRMFPRQGLREMTRIALSLAGADVTYSSCTEFQSSLPTSTAGAITGETAAEWWERFSSGSLSGGSPT